MSDRFHVARRDEKYSNESRYDIKMGKVVVYKDYSKAEKDRMVEQLREMGHIVVDPT